MSDPRIEAMLAAFDASEWPAWSTVTLAAMLAAADAVDPLRVGIEPTPPTEFGCGNCEDLGCLSCQPERFI